jgi:hypothetical protein
MWITVFFYIIFSNATSWLHCNMLKNLDTETFPCLWVEVVEWPCVVLCCPQSSCDWFIFHPAGLRVEITWYKKFPLILLSKAIHLYYLLLFISAHHAFPNGIYHHYLLYLFIWFCLSLLPNGKLGRAVWCLPPFILTPTSLPGLVIVWAEEHIKDEEGIHDNSWVLK